MATSPNLTLPYLDAAQAQKHVTHNDALRMLDALVQTSVLSRVLTAPPATPADGDRYIVPVGASGVWAAQAGKIAAFQDGAWAYYAPRTGWVAWVVAENVLLIFNAGAWGSALSVLQNLALVGVNTTADATNKLAVKSAATLFDNIGNGHQLKLNKAAATDTVSLLYQDGFSGRAELGLAGDDDFHLKVSADGSSYKEALRLDRSTGLGVVFADPTAALGIATKQYVDAHSGGVTSVAGRTGAVTLTASDVSGLGALATASSVNLSTQGAGTLQAAQEPAHTGDVTNTAGSLALTIAANAVTNAKAAQMAANTLKGNSTGAAANAADLTATQAKALLAITVADVAGAVAAAGGTLQNAALLGINATADATNKLAVASSAVLLNNVGNGVQLKLNKNVATDTASILYQDGFSGRAEIGLAGDDNFHFKVSADGSSFKEALQIDRASGLATVFADPTVALGVATKQYVDAHSGGGGGAVLTEAEVDFGAAAVREKKFILTNGSVTATSQILVAQSGKAATGRSADENEMDLLHLRAVPAAGSFTLYAACLTGRVSGKFKVSYQLG